MKNNQNNSARAFVLRATASIALVTVATILLASGFNRMFNSSPARISPLASQAIPHPVIPANHRSVDAPLATWLLGDVFAGVESGNYQVYSNTGTFKETINNALGGFTTGCQFNPAITQLYTTAFGNGQLVKFADADPHPTSSVATTGIPNPESVAFKTNGGYFVGGPGVAAILEFDASDNLVATHAVDPADGTGGTDWIDVAANQTTLFYAAEGRLIKRFDTIAGQLADFATLPGSGNAFAFRLLPPFDGTNGLLIADNGDVKRLDGSGNVIQTYGVAGVSGFFALNLDPDGTSFWTGSFDNGILYRFDLAIGGPPIQMIDTMSGSNALFGVCLRGEITSASSPTPTPTPTPTAIQVSQITPTGTTCSDFSNGTAQTLDRVQYSLKNGKINQVNPGVFFYWVRVTAVAGNNSFNITQTITTGNFSSFFAIQSGSNVFDSNCVSAHPRITQSGGTVTATFNAPTAGTYFIGIKYSANSVVGSPAPSPGTTVHYDFTTTGVPGSTSGLDLVPH